MTSKLLSSQQELFIPYIIYQETESCLICQSSLLYVTDPQENLNLGKYLFCSILFWHLVITKVLVHLSFPEEKALNTAWMIIGFVETQI